MTKFNNISFLRLFALLSIFVFHILLAVSPTEGRFYFPLYFGVQIFLFISAFLYSQKSTIKIKDFLIKNISKILIPFIIFVLLCLLTLLISFLCGGSFESTFYFINFSGTTLFTYGHLWFIFAILACYLLFPFLQKFYKTNNKIFSLICILGFGVDILLCIFEYPQFFITSFLIGFILGKKNFNVSFKTRTNILFIISFICGSIFYYLVKSCTLDINNLFLFNISIQLLIELIAIPFTLLFLQVFKFLNRYEKLGKAFNITDKYSFAFYFMHHYFIFIFNAFFMFLTPYISINILIIFILTLITSYFLEQTSNKIFKKLKFIKK